MLRVYSLGFGGLGLQGFRGLGLQGFRSCGVEELGCSEVGGFGVLCLG